LKVHISRGAATCCGRTPRGWSSSDLTTNPTLASCRRCLYLFYVDAATRWFRAKEEYEAAVARLRVLEEAGL